MLLPKMPRNIMLALAKNKIIQTDAFKADYVISINTYSPNSIVIINVEKLNIANMFS